MDRSRSLKVKSKVVVAKVDNPLVAMLIVGMSEVSSGDWRPAIDEVVN